MLIKSPSLYVGSSCTTCYSPSSSDGSGPLSAAATDGSSGSSAGSSTLFSFDGSSCAAFGCY